MSNKQWI